MKINTGRLIRPGYSFLLIVFIFYLQLFAFTVSSLAQQTTAETHAAGTSKIWGTVDGISIEGLVQGPTGANFPLQVVCLFEYTEGDIYQSPPALPAELNGMVHVDKALHGLITELRKSGMFKGRRFETLLITPPPGTTAAKQILLIGLGDRTKFNADMMSDMGSVALREALNLQVTGFAFASDLKDAGVDSPTGLVAENITKGIIEAYRTQEYLKSKNMTSYKNKILTKVSLLSGPSFFDAAGKGIQEAIASFNRK